MLFSSWRFSKILKRIGDQFVKKGNSLRGMHPFVWSPIKEEKETLELMLEYFINMTSLHSALLRFSATDSEGGNLLVL